MVRSVLVCFALTLSSCSYPSYIAKAYFGRGQNTAIRGYPTVDPPGHFSGIWTHWAYSGRKLAEITYRNGKVDGRSVWYDDHGKPYLIRYYKDGRFAYDTLRKPLGPRGTLYRARRR